MESIKEVTLWPAGNVEIADMRLKRMCPQSSAHPAKKSVNSLTPPVIHPIVRPGGLTKGFNPNRSRKIIPSSGDTPGLPVLSN